MRYAGIGYLILMLSLCYNSFIMSRLGSDHIKDRIHQDYASVMICGTPLPVDQIQEVGRQIDDAVSTAMRYRGCEEIVSTLGNGIQLNPHTEVSMEHRGLLGPQKSRANVQTISDTEFNDSLLLEAKIELPDLFDRTSNLLLIDRNEDDELAYTLEQTSTDGSPTKDTYRDTNGQPAGLVLDEAITRTLLRDFVRQSGGTADRSEEDVIDIIRSLVQRADEFEIAKSTNYKWDTSLTEMNGARIRQIVRKVGLIAVSSLQIDIQTEQSLPDMAGTLRTGLSFASGSLAKPHVRLNMGIFDTSYQQLDVYKRNAIFDKNQAVIRNAEQLGKRLLAVTDFISSPENGRFTIDRQEYDAPLLFTGI